VTRTPLERHFEQRGIVHIEFAHGLRTPAYFTDPAAEHQATRRAAGLFDFSFVACAEIEGRDSLAFLHRLQTRNLAQLAGRRLAYTLLPREDGTVLNDATVWRLGSERYLLFVGRHDDLQHVALLARGYDVSLADRSREHAVLALQGRHAWQIVRRCFAANPPQELPYYGFTAADFEGATCLIARISYSGETGYELVAPAQTAPALWQALLRAGADWGLAECGFEAIDTLRIEAGHILFTRELALPVTPFELGFTRLMDFYHHDFIGKLSMLARRRQTPQRRLAGLAIDGTDVPTLAAATAGDLPAPGIAKLTSVCWSPVLNRAIGLGFVDDADRYPGTRVTVGAGLTARVARLPFYDPAKFLVRHTR